MVLDIRQTVTFRKDKSSIHHDRDREGWLLEACHLIGRQSIYLRLDRRRDSRRVLRREYRWQCEISQERKAANE